MTYFMIFMIGIFVGCFLTTILLCCLQINKINEMKSKYFELERKNLEVSENN